MGNSTGKGSCTTRQATVIHAYGKCIYFTSPVYTLSELLKLAEATRRRDVLGISVASV
jgi:hypothetical protein